MESSSLCQTQADVVEQITQWGIEHAPEEVCGIVHLRPDGMHVYRLKNVAEDPCRGYVFDAGQLVDVMAEEPSRSEIICWHTHPGGLVGPSSEDIKRKAPGVRYLVVAIPGGEAEFF